MNFIEKESIRKQVKNRNELFHVFIERRNVEKNL